MKIGIICGSHRENSQSEKIGRYAARVLETQGIADEAFVYSLAGNPLPFWDEGLWAGEARWEAAIGELRETLKSCDGFVIISPRAAPAPALGTEVASVPSVIPALLFKVGDIELAAPLQDLDWSGFELHDKVAPDEMIAIGVARWGIAETGSLVFHSGADTPILANFLPLHHLVMVRADTILPFLDDYAAATAGQRPPRNVNIVTGASGTTDIEGSLVLGAHGPRFLHVVIVGTPDSSE